jgi:hypothetical protein
MGKTLGLPLLKINISANHCLYSMMHGMPGTAWAAIRHPVSPFGTAMARYVALLVGLPFAAGSGGATTRPSLLLGTAYGASPRQGRQQRTDSSTVRTGAANPAPHPLPLGMQRDGPIMPPTQSCANRRIAGIPGVLAITVACGGAAGCDQSPHTAVVLANGYPTAATAPLVVYRAVWENVAFPTPVEPGSSTSPQPSETTSGVTAYVVLAPGWDPELSATPASLVVLQSRVPISETFDDLLTITVDDTTFAGNCVAGSPLPQAQADFITQVVFPCDFAAYHYDAATCTLTPNHDPDAGVSCDAGS